MIFIAAYESQYSKCLHQQCTEHWFWHHQEWPSGNSRAVQTLWTVITVFALITADSHWWMSKLESIQQHSRSVKILWQLLKL